MQTGLTEIICKNSDVSTRVCFIQLKYQSIMYPRFFEMASKNAAPKTDFKTITRIVGRAVLALG